MTKCRISRNNSTRSFSRRRTADNINVEGATRGKNVEWKGMTGWIQEGVMWLDGGGSHRWISASELIPPPEGVGRVVRARKRKREREEKNVPGRAGEITHFDGIKMSVFPSPIWEDSAPRELTPRCAAAHYTEVSFWLTASYYDSNVGMHFLEELETLWKKVEN